MAKRRKSNIQNIFKIGDLVIAKVKGYSPWPAKVVEIPKPGKYKVKFFVTEELSTTSVELKPFDISMQPNPKDKRTDLVEAFKICHEECERSNGTSNINDTEQVVEVKKRDKKPKSEEVGTKDKHEDTDLLKTNETDTPLPNASNGITADEESAQKKEVKLESTSVDCSLNDLTSEQANADRGTEKLSTKAELSLKTNETKTIEKLRKKLQKKLAEKEDKKKNRIEKKKFEKVFSKLERKQIARFQSLTQAAEKFVINSNDQRNAIQLKTSMQNCEKNLDTLKLYLERLFSDYGRTRKELKDFHKLLETLVLHLQKVRNKNIKPTSKEAKHFLGELKSRPIIKDFINSFTGSTIETKEELIVERKENARKRMKLTR